MPRRGGAAARPEAARGRRRGGAPPSGRSAPACADGRRPTSRSATAGVRARAGGPGRRPHPAGLRPSPLPRRRPPRRRAPR
ncbi:hypothetical protein FZ103_23175 [Streptomonospora sp. PA3]|nr:hypothetical protein [Streptomonospora sp. PA3]